MRELTRRQWNALARIHGYPSMRALLIDLHLLHARSVTAIGRMIHTSRWTIRLLLKNFKVPSRPAGEILTRESKIVWQGELSKEARRPPQKSPAPPLLHADQ